MGLSSTGFWPFFFRCISLLSGPENVWAQNKFIKKLRNLISQVTESEPKRYNFPTNWAVKRPCSEHNPVKFRLDPTAQNVMALDIAVKKSVWRRYWPVPLVQHMDCPGVEFVPEWWEAEAQGHTVISTARLSSRCVICWRVSDSVLSSCTVLLVSLRGPEFHSSVITRLWIGPLGSEYW
jgi:hypothetical protein